MHVQRLHGVILGCLWATPLLLAGLWLLDWSLPAGGTDMFQETWAARTGAVMIIAASQLIFLAFVADSLFPSAPTWLSASLKVFYGALFCLGLVLMGLLASGLAEAIFRGP